MNSLSSSIHSSSPPSSLGTSLNSPVPSESKALSRKYRFSTLVATVESPDSSHQDPHNASSVPIYQSATFKGLGGSSSGYDYSRSGNPTRKFLEYHISKISNCKHAFSVTSGMGALDIILRILKPGDKIIAGTDLYGGSHRLLTYMRDHSNISTHHLDTTSPSSLLPYLQSSHPIKLVLLESPTNPLLQIVDIQEICRLMRLYKPEAVVVVDNTMMSPYLMRPLEFGADVVYDSATKYLSGHHDLMAGVICTDRDDLAKQFYHVINSTGCGLAPFDAFLLLRGIKTLSIRLDRQQSNAIRIARYLHDLGFLVRYPGIDSHPGKAVHDRHAKGYGAVLSFETGDVGISERVVGGTRLWGVSVSFGCVNSLISMPCLMSHASIDPAIRASRKLPEDLIRLCVGIEDPEDLVEDLENSLLEAGAVEYIPGTSKLRKALSLEEKLQELTTTMTQTGLNSSSHETLLVSAPGKVILFGEHAVVHGVTAIAGNIDLRCYCFVQSRSDGKVLLELQDAGIEFSWNVEEMPWHLLRKDVDGKEKLNVELVEELERDAKERVSDKNVRISAVVMFGYLWMHLAGGSRKPQTITLRSSLPIGAGLGSSAAVCVCLASSLLYTHSLLTYPTPNLPIPESDKELVNSWAFVGETIMHGNPSGVDNSVATFGGAIAFKKGLNGAKASMEGLHGFKSIRFLLTDTKVPRDTKALVAAVGKRKSDNPEFVNPILESIQSISDEARKSLISTDITRDQQIHTLEKLIDENHEYLNQLGVGHPSLEAIKAVTAIEPFNLHTKLTGAGGGGCAVTILPDDFSDALLEDLKKNLSERGFVPYLTSVGGSGFGIMKLDLPSRDLVEVGGDEVFDLSEIEKFRKARAEELGAVVKTMGEWQF